jgi:hypothetical protein
MKSFRVAFCQQHIGGSRIDQLIETRGIFMRKIIVVEGYNHLDVCVAAPDRPSRRQNELNDPILDFVLGIL